MCKLSMNDFTLQLVNSEIISVGCQWTVFNAALLLSIRFDVQYSTVVCICVYVCLYSHIYFFDLHIIIYVFFLLIF